MLNMTAIKFFLHIQWRTQD